MGEMSLASCCAYLTVVGGWRDSDYHANYLAKAVKGEPIKATRRAQMPNGEWAVGGDRAPAIRYFVNWAASQIRARFDGPVVIVPIPGSKIVESSAANYRTATLARAIASGDANWVHAPVLRFKKPMPSAHSEGGSRDPLVLIENMHLIGEVPEGEVILFDDMVTSGGHMKASMTIMETIRRPVSFALTCGLSVEQQLANPFSVAEKTIVIGDTLFW